MGLLRELFECWPRWRVFAAALLVVILGALALANGAAGNEVVRWGSFGFNTGVVPEPEAVAGVGDAIAVDAGNSSSYLLASDGSVWAWGHGGEGQLGDGSTRNSETTAVRVEFPAGVKVTSIGEAENTGLAIDSNGKGWAWGFIGATTCQGHSADEGETPQPVPGIANAVAVQGGEHHTVWLLANGTVETCGNNQEGQLGVIGPSSATPVAVPGLHEVVEISAGERTSCARTASGAVYDWGADANGQIGNGTRESVVSTPYHVPLPGPASEISCGGNLPQNGHTLALVGGEVYAWGADGAGQLGDGETKDEPSPVATGLHFAHVVASGATSYGLTFTGQLWAWGSDFLQALGTEEGGPALVPELVTEHATAISGTAHNAAAIME